jgi:3',5'-cyclic AMP phosphodiesterase CpdA
MVVFRLLHASDLHFGQTPGQVGVPVLLQNPYWWWAGIPGTPAMASSHNLDRVDALAAFAFYKRQRYDAILVTGDLATTGKADDLNAAYEFIASPAVKGYLNAAGRPTLQAAGRPLYLLPGNHDRFGAFYLPGGAEFDKVFATVWPVGQGVHVWPPLVSQSEGETLVLVGVDFTLRTADAGQGFLGYLGQGRASHLVDALVQATEEVHRQHPGCTILWALHFEPGTTQFLHELLDEGDLEQAIQQKIAPPKARAKPAVAAILCGHTHRQRLSTFGGTPVHVCGTTTQHLPVQGRPPFKENSLQVIEITLDPDPKKAAAISVRPYRYTSSLRGFAP